MASVGKSLDTLKNQFHSRSVNYTYFRNITTEDIERIKKIIERRTEGTKYSIQINKGLENYYLALYYLTRPTASRDLPSFDEKILYLILSTDPNLTTIKLFLETNIPIKEEIDKIEDSKEKERKLQERNTIIHDYIQRVRNAIGFYDEKYLRYESTLLNGILKEQEFASDVKTPSIMEIEKRASKIINLNIISDLNLARLKRIAEKYQIEAKDSTDLNSLAYNLINRPKSLHLYTIEEQVILFLLIADPTLRLLTIFEEESTYPKMEQRAKEELGFYGKGCLKAEQLYHKKFEPTKKVSAWTI